jgi:ribosomal protein L11 methyltransferase
MVDHQLQPDTLLHVYCLAGRLPKDQNFPAGFLGNWEEEGYSYLFFNLEVSHYIAGIARDRHLDLVDYQCMPYSQWQQSHQGPISVGGLTFLPAEMRGRAEDNGAPIYLDPGVVFGDGLHPTTRQCLTIMQRLFDTERISILLDLGTGSGVLALAGVKLGCARVAAVDNIFLAARTAKRNVTLNGYADRIMVVNGEAAGCLSGASDLLVANIQPEIIHQIVDSSVFQQTSWFIFSGIQHHELHQVVVHLEEKSVIIVDRIETGGAWQTVWGRARCK